MVGKVMIFIVLHLDKSAKSGRRVWNIVKETLTALQQHDRRDIEMKTKRLKFCIYHPPCNSNTIRTDVRDEEDLGGGGVGKNYNVTQRSKCLKQDTELIFINLF